MCHFADLRFADPFFADFELTQVRKYRTYFSPQKSVSVPDILMWMGIRICGFMPLTNGSGFLLFSSLTFKRPTNNYFFKIKFFCLLLIDCTFTSSFKDKMSKRSHEISRNQGLLFLLDDRRIRTHTSDQWIRIREAQKHVDPLRGVPRILPGGMHIFG